MPVLAFLGSRLILTIILGILGIAATAVLGHVIEKDVQALGDETEDVIEAVKRLLSPLVVVGVVAFLFLLKRKG